MHFSLDSKDDLIPLRLSIGNVRHQHNNSPLGLCLTWMTTLDKTNIFCCLIKGCCLHGTPGKTSALYTGKETPLKSVRVEQNLQSMLAGRKMQKRPKHVLHSVTHVFATLT